ncbi:hypothetical protein [Aliiglaciecola litoralis]|uniref:Uncharacterized protein n=1 Tax=Aliiglaciecola litoralis TaxID=582857 RepID=A0ABN1LE59_9ALTE
MNKSVLTLFICTLFSAHHVNAGKAIDHSLQASKHSVLAVAEGVGSAVVVASAVVAIPIIIVGGTVAHSAQAIAETMQHQHHAPLTVTDITITVDPAPNKAIRSIHVKH